MAFHIGSSTDKLYYVEPAVAPAKGTLSIFMKSTNATANTILASYWNGSSRSGWGLILNNTSGKVTAQGYDSSAVRLNMTGATTVNDGNPHHVAFAYDRDGQFSPGLQSVLYVDGAQDATPAYSSADWISGSGGFFYEMGKNSDAFWGAFVGDVWEFAHWNAMLTATEIAALAKGFPAKLIRPSALVACAPLVNSTHEIRKGLTINTQSGTVSTHGRMVGGAV